VEATAVDLKRTRHLGSRLTVDSRKARPRAPAMRRLQGGDRFNSVWSHGADASQSRRVIAMQHVGSGSTEPCDPPDSISAFALYFRVRPLLP
jgi:hypothetical protein